jgi:hypothetical protein
MKRSAILDTLAERVFSMSRPHPVRVAIDGVDAAAGREYTPIRETGESMSHIRF